ncbi:MAG TPA: hypothetical protein VJK06_01245 [Methyloceanibacter sp.]|nr:hypothetical protein [Methyloceanibacter sp.]
MPSLYAAWLILAPLGLDTLTGDLGADGATLNSLLKGDFIL